MSTYCGIISTNEHKLLLNFTKLNLLYHGLPPKELCTQKKETLPVKQPEGLGS